MNRRLFIKRAGLLAGLGLIQPVELIKLFKSKSTTFYSLPPPKALTTEQIADVLKKVYGEGIVSLFDRKMTFEVFGRYKVTPEHKRGVGYQFAIKQA